MKISHENTFQGQTEAHLGMQYDLISIQFVFLKCTFVKKIFLFTIFFAFFPPLHHIFQVLLRQLFLAALRHKMNVFRHCRSEINLIWFTHCGKGEREATVAVSNVSSLTLLRLLSLIVQLCPSATRTSAGFYCEGLLSVWGKARHRTWLLFGVIIKFAERRLHQPWLGG